MQTHKLRTTRHATPQKPLLLFGAALKPDGSPTQTLRNRVAAAVRFGQSQPAILYIPTGGAQKKRTNRSQRYAQASACARYPGHFHFVGRHGF